jgi:gamma-glutamylcyclotransferase (GGCT)/AIG2-like uncharacterized protein YtfP
VTTTATKIVNRVFVYGTLKRGGSNERIWGAEPVSVNAGSLPCVDLYDLGAFPAMVAPGTSTVIGEVWEIAEADMPAVLKRLDFLEGYRGPGARNHYERAVVDVVLEATGEVVQAYGYWMTKPPQYARKVEGLLVQWTAPADEDDRPDWTDEDEEPDFEDE